MTNSKMPKNLLSLWKTKVDKEDIEDVIVGCAFPEGEQGFNIGKVVTFMCGFPKTVAGIDRKSVV